MNFRRSQLPRGQHSVWNNQLDMQGCDTELHSLAVQVFAEGLERAAEDQSEGRRSEPPRDREKFLHDMVAQPKWVRGEARYVLREAYSDPRIRRPVGFAIKRVISVFKSEWIIRSDRAREDGSLDEAGLNHRWECLECTSLCHGNWDCCWNCGKIDVAQTRLLRDHPTW